jgi:rare lipoprotein A
MVGFLSALAACSGGADLLAKLEQGTAPVPSEQVAEVEEAAQDNNRSAVDKPYLLAGKWFAPEADPDYDRTGTASWYGAAFQGRLTANGETFDRTALSAAHPTMPLPSYVRVTNLENDRSVVVRVNDRGPYSGGRLIDVSERTAELLAFHRDGTTEVRVEYLSPAPAERKDEGMLLASYRGPGGTPGQPHGTRLASAEPRTLVPVSAGERGPTTVAFADEARGSAIGGEATEALQTLTGAFSADERIFMAFQVASEVDE